MIPGFEKETAQLTSTEKRMIPHITKYLLDKKGEKKAITGYQISQYLNDSWAAEKFSGARIRKLINYIRMNNIIKCLVATSSGYYIESDPEKIQIYITSLRARANAINAVARKLEKQSTGAPVQEKLFNITPERQRD